MNWALYENGKITAVFESESKAYAHMGIIIDSMYVLHITDEECIMWIAGNGETKESLKAEIAQLKAENKNLLDANKSNLRMMRDYKRLRPW